MYHYRKLSHEEQQKLVEERKKRGLLYHQPPHPIKDHRYYLITAACFEHKPLLHSDERRCYLREMLFAELKSVEVDIHAWSILPNHYHFLAEVADFEAMAKCIGQVHGRTSFEWNKEDRKQGRKVWYRYADRAIRSERHYWAVVNYIHFNPVKHGLVESPYDWRASSLGWYVEGLGREWLRENWKEFPIDQMGTGWDEF